MPTDRLAAPFCKALERNPNIRRTGLMHRYSALAIVSAGRSLGVPVFSAATQPIGVAMSEGAILVNDTQTPGNATIFNTACIII
jgi:hypothetical protein